MDATIVAALQITGVVWQKGKHSRYKLREKGARLHLLGNCFIARPPPTLPLNREGGL